MSALRGNPEDIYSDRVLPTLTLNWKTGPADDVGPSGWPRLVSGKRLARARAACGGKTQIIGAQ